MKTKELKEKIEQVNNDIKYHRKRIDNKLSLITSIQKDIHETRDIIQDKRDELRHLEILLIDAEENDLKPELEKKKREFKKRFEVK